MNPKIANLIAIETGILVGLMSWLVYSQFPSRESRNASEMRERAVSPFAPVAPVVRPRNQLPGTVAYTADGQQVQLVDEYAAQPAPVYYRTVAAGTYTRPGFNNGTIAVQSPSYAEVDQEPAAAPVDYAAYTQPVVYAQPTQLVVYNEPAPTVVFSNSRRFPNRGRSIPRACPPQVITPRLNTLSAGPSGNRLLSSGPSGNVLSQATAIAPSRRPVEGFRPRRNR
jgi:hypothetical protein